MVQLQLIVLQLLLFASCASPDTQASQSTFADVTSVSISGSENRYSFSVTISSPDKGCDQYADWWEVVSESGELIYRRILLHSHVSEQPFTRSGGPVTISKDQVVWVRAHMNNSGYGGKGMKGSAAKGFETTEFPEDFAAGLEQASPLPSGCNF